MDQNRIKLNHPVPSITCAGRIQLHHIFNGIFIEISICSYGNVHQYNIFDSLPIAVSSHRRSSVHFLQNTYKIYGDVDISETLGYPMQILLTL